MALRVPPPPFGTPQVDPKTGQSTRQWEAFWLALSQATTTDFAPSNAPFLTWTSDSLLNNDVNLGQLSTGYLRITVAAGVATPSTVSTIPSSAISGGDALTKVDDTNVTLTLGGSPATAVLHGTSLTLGWQGTLSVARGGTGTNNSTQTYTPTLTNVANITGSTPYVCQFVRVGSFVMVSGAVDIDPTSATTLTRLGISLPAASNFSAAEQCGGTAVAPAVTGYAAAVVADPTNDRAELQFTTGSDVANRSWSFQFSYQVV